MIWLEPILALGRTVFESKAGLALDQFLSSKRSGVLVMGFLEWGVFNDENGALGSDDVRPVGSQWDTAHPVARVAPRRRHQPLRLRGELFILKRAVSGSERAKQEWAIVAYRLVFHQERADFVKGFHIRHLFANKLSHGVPIPFESLSSLSNIDYDLANVLLNGISSNVDLLYRLEELASSVRRILLKFLLLLRYRGLVGGHFGEVEEHQEDRFVEGFKWGYFADNGL